MVGQLRSAQQLRVAIILSIYRWLPLYLFSFQLGMFVLFPQHFYLFKLLYGGCFIYKVGVKVYFMSRKAMSHTKMHSWMCYIGTHIYV
jgi:hypothetical protein